MIEDSISHILYTNGAIRDADKKMIGFWDGKILSINLPEGGGIKFFVTDAESAMDLVAKHRA